MCVSTDVYRATYAGFEIMRMFKKGQFDFTRTPGFSIFSLADLLIFNTCNVSVKMIISILVKRLLVSKNIL